MNLINNIRAYFDKLAKNEDPGKAPEAICPNCWGRQDWNGEYYTFSKGNAGNPKEDLYNNFVKEVARKVGDITLHPDTYICETCNVKYDRSKD